MNCCIRDRDDPFHLLPDEILGEIFNKISQNDVIKHRLVCKKWDMAIKTFHNFAIRLDEDSHGTEFISQLRIVNLKVKKLIRTRIRTIPPDEETEEPEMLFKFPKLIQRISTGKQVSATNLQQLIQLCQKTVIGVVLKLSAEQLDHQFPASIFYDFLNVRRLELQTDFCSDLLWNTNDPGSTLLSQFGNSNFLNLEELSVSISSIEKRRGIYSAVGSVLKLASRNPRGLKHLSFEVKHYLNTLGDSWSGRVHKPLCQQLSPEELARLKTVRNLEIVHFSADLFEQQDGTNVAVLLDMISRQRKLKEINLCSTVPLGGAILESLSLNSFETLVHINIEALEVNANRPFSLSVFRNCHKLKDLHLRRNQRFPKEGLGPELINLQSLPTSLECLDLNELKILSRDLLNLLDSEVLNSLKYLLLYNCGRFGDFGVDFAVLEKVAYLETKRLERVRLIGWNVGSIAELTIKPTAIMTKLGISGRNILKTRLILVRDDENRLRVPHS